MDLVENQWIQMQLVGSFHTKGCYLPEHMKNVLLC
jgi:hypothetical protein